MEKEMKKLLLVAVSVGVFLLVTIAVALIVLTPKTQANESSSSVPYSQGRILPAPEAIETAPDQPVIGTAEREPVIEPAAVIAAVDSNNGNNITIHVVEPAAVPANQTVTTTASSSSSVTAESTTPVQTTRRSTSAAARTSSSTTTTTSSTSRTAAASTASRTTTARTINDYWIQIGAYRAMIRAEDARELLASKGLVSIIENREINGQNLYRVRLGPYTSEREANHWLAIVKNINGFGESQIRQTVRTQ